MEAQLAMEVGARRGRVTNGLDCPTATCVAADMKAATRRAAWTKRSASVLHICIGFSVCSQPKQAAFIICNSLAKPYSLFWEAIIHVFATALGGYSRVRYNFGRLFTCLPQFLEANHMVATSLGGYSRACYKAAFGPGLNCRASVDAMLIPVPIIIAVLQGR